MLHKAHSGFQESWEGEPLAAKGDDLNAHQVLRRIDPYVGDADTKNASSNKKTVKTTKKNKKKQENDQCRSYVQNAYDR